MKLILMAALCALYVHHADSSDSFHCLRLNQDCVADTCDPATGLCTCTAGATGEDCSITAAVAATSCVTDPGCDPIGTRGCHVEGAVDTCFCNEDYTDTLCDKKRISLSCTATAIVPTIIPFEEGSFTGSAYAETKSSVPACVLAGDGATIVGQTLSIPFADTDSCGVATTDIFAADGTTKIGDQHCIGIVMQYNPDYMTSNDLLSTMCCKVYTADTVVDEAIINSATIDDTGALATASNTVTETGVSVVIQISSATVTSGTLGDETTLLYTLDTALGYAEFLVWEVGFDTATTAGAGTKYLVQLGCAQTPFAKVIKSFTKLVSNDIALVFYAFKFVGTQSVNIFTKVKVCPSSCTPPVCTAGSDITLSATITAVGRRKRQAGDEDKLESLKMSFLVLDRSDFTKAAVFDKSAQPQQSCLSNMAFLLPLVALVVICLMSMAAAMFFCLKLSQRSRNDPESSQGVVGPYKG